MLAVLLWDNMPWETCLFKQEEVYEGAGWASRPVFGQRTLFSCQGRLHHWHFNKDFVEVGVRCGWDGSAAGGWVFDEGTLGNTQRSRGVVRHVAFVTMSA